MGRPPFAHHHPTPPTTYFGTDASCCENWYWYHTEFEEPFHSEPFFLARMSWLSMAELYEIKKNAALPTDERTRRNKTAMASRSSRHRVSHSQEEKGEGASTSQLLRTELPIHAYIPAYLQNVIFPCHGDFCQTPVFHYRLIAQLMAEGETTAALQSRGPHLVHTALFFDFRILAYCHRGCVVAETAPTTMHHSTPRRTARKEISSQKVQTLFLECQSCV